jgi:hypothetical protein
MLTASFSSIVVNSILLGVTMYGPNGAPLNHKALSSFASSSGSHLMAKSELLGFPVLAKLVQ